MVDEREPQQGPPAGPAPLTPPGDSGEQTTPWTSAPHGAVGPSPLFGAGDHQPWGTADPFGGGPVGGGPLVPPSGPPLGPPPGSGPFLGAPPPVAPPPQRSHRWAWVLGSVTLCVLVALAAWSAVRQVQDARDSSAAPDPLDGEIPGGGVPSTTVGPGDPFGAGDPYVPVLPGEEDPPEDADLSREQIRAAYDTAFDQTATPEQWLAAVDAPVEVGEQLKTLAAGCGTARVSVDHVAFRSPEEAAVEFRFRNVTVPAGDAVVFGGGAERVEGRWMVTGWTIDKVIAIAGPFCQ